MSPDIWTQCAAFNVVAIRRRPWRVVEAQHVNSTRKLVDSDDEQEVLEALIDGVKPPLPAPVRRARLHYLLATPFRHPPLAHGSRFGGRREPGIWYGAETRRTAFCEKAYYTLLFLEGTTADLGVVSQPLTVFQCRVATDRGADLTVSPFERFGEEISSPVSYAASQPLGASLRAAGVKALRYASARDRQGVNLALFEPAFASPRPFNEQGWVVTADRDAVEFKPTVARRDRSRVRLLRQAFEVDGVLPAPGLG